MPNKFIVEFAGICCHYDPVADNVPNPPYLMRTIVLDRRASGMPHLPHLEVQAMGIKENNWGVALSQPYTRDGIAYQYLELDKVRITIDTTDPPFDIKNSFKSEVPRLPLVCNKFGDLKSTHYLKDDPNTAAGSDIVAAHFDMHFGDLSVRKRTKKMTTFYPPHKWPKHDPEPVPFPRAVDLEVNTAGETTITARAFNDLATAKTLKLYDWVPRIRIGNLTEKGRLGLYDPHEQHHFYHYYVMADAGHCNPEPIPKDDIQDDRGLGGGCSNTNYP